MNITDNIITAPDFYISGVDANELIQACRQAKPDKDQTDLLRRINGAVKNVQFRHVLSRTGWHRQGGVVTGEGQRVTGNLRTWAEHESAGQDRKSTRLNSSHTDISRMPSSA